MTSKPKQQKTLKHSLIWSCLVDMQQISLEGPLQGFSPLDMTTDNVLNL